MGVHVSKASSSSSSCEQLCENSLHNYICLENTSCHLTSTFGQLCARELVKGLEESCTNPRLPQTPLVCSSVVTKAQQKQLEPKAAWGRKGFDLHFQVTVPH